jgi:uncharacterized protein YegP (UPF0339 family)
MRTLFRSLALFALVAAVVASAGTTEAPALQKEKDKDKKAAEEAVGTVEVYQAKDGWRFKVVNAEGKSVAIGTVGYAKKEDALKAVEFLKNTLAKGKVNEAKDAKDDKKDDKKAPAKDDKK